MKAAREKDSSCIIKTDKINGWLLPKWMEDIHPLHDLLTPKDMSGQGLIANSLRN